MTPPRRVSPWRVAALLAALVSVAWLGPAAAQDRPAGGPERRVALVIGNAAYQTSPLRNPTNDAQDMASALKDMGFTVALRTDADQRQMKQAIREFGAEVRKGAIALFYFAGHGIQSSRGKNFLIPVRAQIESEPELEDAAVDLNFVLSFMEDAKNNVNVVILDACRNNPFGRGLRSGTRGLAQVDAARGTLIAFATSPGSVALDGASGRNGVYTKHLLQSLRQSESDVERVFKRVRKSVYQETSGQQVPWESSSLIGDFAFGVAAAGGAARPPAPAPAPTPAPAIDPVAFETALWNEIKDRNQPSEMRAYLQQYPNGRYAGQARARLSQQPAPSAPLPAPEPARGMLGTWSGYYGYNQGRQANVPFKLTITAIEGQSFAGMISEPATFGDGSSRFLFARVRGRVEGGRVQFVKTYDGTGGQTHSVTYQGQLDGEAALKGGWAIAERGRTTATGFFAATQN